MRYTDANVEYAELTDSDERLITTLLVWCPVAIKEAYEIAMDLPDWPDPLIPVHLLTT